LDEGAVEDLPGQPKLIYQPGVYEFNDIKFQGMPIDHDRIGGKRFGVNTAWRWKQAGVNILHLGGAAGDIKEQRILMSPPLPDRLDVLIVPVGGSAKAYNAQEAKQVIDQLNPRLIIPTHYRTQAADKETCKGEFDIAPLDDFLTVMSGTKVRRSNSDTISINPGNIPENRTIQVFSYNF